MAVYPIQELKNKITDRILDNHERAITGDELQEVLLDVLDSLETYTDEAVVEPAVNYYVDEVAFDTATGALTLTRVGGIAPENISVDLDGRYKQIGLSDIKSDTVTVDAGAQFVEFPETFPEGTEYTLGALVGFTAEGDDMIRRGYDKQESGFWVNFSEPVTFDYQAVKKQ
jgi:hypothetical protein